MTSTTDLIEVESIEQDQVVIYLNIRIYQLEQIVTISDLSLTSGPRVKKIAFKKALKNGMASRL